MLDSLILLQLVKEGPLHGYGLTSCMEEKFGWKPSQTAVYNSLKDMENRDLVTVEERIEKGRVQKIYTITEQGQEFANKAHKTMRDRMRNNFSQIIAISQMVSEVENAEESESLQIKLNSILENLGKISFMLLPLVREAPNETESIIEKTYISLKKIASKYNIQLNEEENINEETS
jgi:DNA-binding PadR family transcriptional regulator